MRHRKAAFRAKGGKGAVGVHVQIARIGPHIARDETGGVERRGIGVFDGGDIAGFDPQFALNVQQRFAKRGTFAAHDIAKAQFEIVKPFRICVLLNDLGSFPPDHTLAPY